MKSFYELLGASADDDAEAVKKAFRKAVKAHHPDLHPNDPDALERFRQVIAARASHDRRLALERHRLKVERQRRQSQRERQQLRFKLRGTTVAVATVVALVGGYGVFAPISMTAMMEIAKDRDAATTGAVVSQTATVVAANENENPSAPIAPAKAEAVKGDIDNAGKPIETTGAHVIEPTDAPDQGQQRHKHDGTEVPNGASKPSADKQDAKVVNEANKPSDDAAAIMRLVMQRLRDSGDAQATAGRELTLGYAKVPDEANKPSAGKHEDAKVPNEAHELSDDAAAIMRFVMQRLRDGLDAQATAGRELALGPPATDASFYRERGIAAYGSGDFLGAIGNFDEAIRLNPNDAQSYNIRGNVWDELGILERALADYDEAIRIDPNNPAVFHDRAILWQREGELDKALIDLDRAIRFSFSDVNMYCDRGLVWYQKGRHDRAVADFDRAIKLEPNSAAACIKRGLIVHRNSKFKLAFATVNQAIRVDPSIFDALLGANLHP
jgi:tetratricopeptide (TPR) repeat protein